VDPGFVLVRGGGGELHLDAEAVAFEEEVSEEGGGAELFGEFDEDAEGKAVVDDGLADVEDAGSVAGEDGGEGMGEAGLIVAGNVDEQGAGCAGGGHKNQFSWGWGQGLGA
jgi:hypothetical protein